MYGSIPFFHRVCPDSWKEKMTDQHCKKCFYWDIENKRVENGKAVAACVVDGPRAVMNNNRIFTFWPQTPETARCGRFRIRDEHESL